MLPTTYNQPPTHAFNALTTAIPPRPTLANREASLQRMRCQNQYTHGIEECANRSETASEAGLGEIASASASYVGGSSSRGLRGGAARGRTRRGVAHRGVTRGGRMERINRGASGTSSLSEGLGTAETEFLAVLLPFQVCLAILLAVPGIHLLLDGKRSQ